MLSVVLIPLSIYPCILSQLGENNLWHWSFAVQITPFLGMLYWARFGHWPVPDKPQKIRFNFLQAILLSAFICGGPIFCCAANALTGSEIRRLSS